MTHTADPAPPVTADDVANAYRLFLGRVPEDPSGAAGWVGEDGAWFLTTLIGSREFAESVLSPLNAGGMLPHQGMAERPPADLLAWASDRLPLSAPASAAVTDATAWGQALRTVLTDPDFASTVLAIALTLAGIDQAEGPPIRRVVGEIRYDGGIGVTGWAADTAALDSPVAVTLLADGRAVCQAVADRPHRLAGLRVGGDGRFGFALTLPPALMDAGTGPVTVAMRAEPGEAAVGRPITVSFDLAAREHAVAAARAAYAQAGHRLGGAAARLVDAVDRNAPSPALYDAYRKRHYGPDAGRRRDLAAAAAAWPDRPLISVLLTDGGTPPARPDRVLDAVTGQTYDRWELVLAAPAAAGLAGRRARDPRIRSVVLEDEPGTAGAFDAALAAVRGSICVLIDPGEALTAEALHGVAVTMRDPAVALLTADEDRFTLSDAGTVSYGEPRLKPLPDPDLLWSLNQIGKPLAVQTDLLRQTGGIRFDRAADWALDLTLRCLETIPPGGWRHVPRILSSRPADRRPGTTDAAIADVQAHLDRLGLSVRVVAHDDPVGGAMPGARRLVWPLPDPPPKVGILIPTRDRRDLLEPCIESIRHSLAGYPGTVEILIGDNGTTAADALDYLAAVQRDAGARVIPAAGPFNWSDINNTLAARTDADVLVFLNNDTLVLTPDWLTELVAQACRPDVGAVGPRLVYADGTIQNAGVVVGAKGAALSEAIGEFPSTGIRTRIAHQCAAVLGACLVTRRAVFERTGGFDATHHRVAFNEVDYCLKLRAAGLKVVYTPFATLYHLESQSRGLDLSADKQALFRTEHAHLADRWSDAALTDPFMNPHFEPMADPYTRLRPPPALW